MKADQKTLSYYLLAAAEQDNTHVYFWNSSQEIEKFSYAQLLSGALKIAGFLQSKGIQQGQKVALVLPTHPDFYQAFFGIVLAGAIPAALYPPLRLGKIEEWKQRTAQMLKAIDCKMILTNASLHALLGFPAKEARPARGCFTVNSILAGEGFSGVIAKVSSTETAFVQFSSGTTGFPKPIALSHENILYMGKSFIDMLPGNAHEYHCISWLPVYHDMGLIGTLVSTLMASANLTLIPPEKFLARPKTWLEAMSKMKGTISVAPNFAYGLCCKRITENDLEGLDLSSWRVALCGAEPIQAKTLNLFAERFEKVGFNRKAFTPAYGLAEATLAVTLSSIDEGVLEKQFDREKLESEEKAELNSQGVGIVSVGHTVEGVQIEIRNTEGIKLSENHAGRIWVKGPNVMQGYLDDEESTKKTIVEDWLDTGDRGFIHDTNLYLCGRYKDLIIIRGKNFDPSLMEESLDEISGLRIGSALAFGETDKDSDTERLVILAELTEIKNISGEFQKKIVAAIQEKILTKFQISVSEIVLLEAGTLPRTSSGKKQRQLAKKLWKENSLAAPEKHLTWVYVRESIKGFFQHKVP